MGSGANVNRMIPSRAVRDEGEPADRPGIDGEPERELLREAGNYASIRDYERARAGGEDLAPLPSLFIVVDEFSEMLTAKPEFIDLFVAIGRLGRSLHIHLLLASQRLEEGKLRGLDSHLSYRIGLKTFSASESRAVLGVPDAYHLPSTPGAGFLKFDADPPRRFGMIDRRAQRRLCSACGVSDRREGIVRERHEDRLRQHAR